MPTSGNIQQCQQKFGGQSVLYQLEAQQANSLNFKNELKLSQKQHNYKQIKFKKNGTQHKAIKFCNRVKKKKYKAKFKKCWEWP